MIRMNSIWDLFCSGMAYAPLGRRWVEEVRQEFAEFPDGGSTTWSMPPFRD
jgi:hypothetical protein